MLDLRGRQQSRHSHESGNPGGITTAKCIFFLDASLRGHDGPEPIKTKLTRYYSLFYIPLINSRMVPSGSLKHTTPIFAPPGPSIFFSGATNSTFFAFSSS